LELKSRLGRVSKRMPWIEFGLALCVLIAVAAASDTVTSRLASAEYWVVHTHDVEAETAQARNDLVAMGDARQIYIITGDPEPLAEYQRAKSALPGELSQLGQMTSDNAAEQANLAELRGIVNQRIGLLQQSIDLREKSGEDTQQQKQWTRDGLALQNQALAIFDRMKVEEDRLMALRQTISTQTYRRVRIVLLISFGGGPASQHQFL
jgi:CHASE3 domain sensor protein